MTHGISGLFQLKCAPTTALRGFRRGAQRAVMLEHYKRQAKMPGAAGASPAYRRRGDTPRWLPGGRGGVPRMP